MAIGRGPCKPQNPIRAAALKHIATPYGVDTAHYRFIRGVSTLTIVCQSCGLVCRSHSEIKVGSIYSFLRARAFSTL